MKGKEICVGLLVIAFLIGVPVSGYSGFVSGHTLVENMREYEKFEKDPSGSTYDNFKMGHYMGYVTGVADVLVNLGTIKVEEVTVGQLCAVVAKYLKANPEQWHQSASYFVVMALQEAFPRESKKIQIE